MTTEPRPAHDPSPTEVDEPGATPGIAFEAPAETPEQRVARLEQVKDELRTSRDFASAHRFCLNARYAWDGLFGAWRVLNGRDELLKRFVIAMKAGRMLLSAVEPRNAEQSRLLPAYMKSCTARWEWGRLLLENPEDTTVVTGQMDAFVERELSRGKAVG